MPKAIAKSITRMLSSPNQVARVLDWKKAVGGALLSLHFGASQIDLAATSHPSGQDACVHHLSSIPLEFEVKQNNKVLKSHILKEISGLVQDLNVCGMVVSWPVQKEGWCGAPCGKVLHTLDHIVRETNIVDQDHCPLCLWDGHHFRLPEDEWGRLAIYGIPNRDKKQVHLASQEQYRECGMVAARVVKDYIRHHWPDHANNLSEDFGPFTPITVKPTAAVVVAPNWLKPNAKVSFI